MAQTISRKRGVRRQSRPQRGRSARKAGSLFDPLMQAMGLSEGQWHAVFTVLILALAAALAVAVAVYAGAAELARLKVAQLAADGGYEVKRVEVRGVERMSELKVYERALGERNRAMSELDIGALRESLLKLPYVRDARILRQLPDGLVVDIVERQPHAVLREGERLLLIDEEGRRLEPLRGEVPSGMLVLAGAGAAGKVGDLDRLLAAAPDLKGQVVGAEWVGNRRWNLTFATGQNLALPQGKDRAAGALVSFERLDGVSGLIGGQVAAFDMRSPERIYMRVPGRAAQARAIAEEGT